MYFAVTTVNGRPQEVVAAVNPSSAMKGLSKWLYGEFRRLDDVPRLVFIVEANTLREMRKQVKKALIPKYVFINGKFIGGNTNDTERN